MRLVLMGPPGAGKGTLADLLKSSLKIPHISTGDILREEMKKDTALGRKAKEFIESGGLVPDEIVTKLVDNRLSKDASLKKGFMLDGFPRTRQQAEDLDKILERLQQPLDCALYLESTLPVIIKRLTGRRICKSCGAVFHIKNRPPKKEGICDRCNGQLHQRADDNEGTIKTRMDVYLNNTLPIVDYYEEKGKLEKLDGDRESEDLEEQLLKKFNEEGILN
ncbi:MAG TPA: adenylate kinase [Candidatus Omnitrophota bacterium]|nr:adenylate kinase [Candidatus Omnitrophota bacterium]